MSGQLQGPGGRARGRRAVPAVGCAAAVWCLGFAGVSAWLVVAGPAGPQRYAADASGLAVMSVLVGLLKLAGAAVALAAVRMRPGGGRRLPRLLALLLAAAPTVLGRPGLLPT